MSRAARARLVAAARDTAIPEGTQLLSLDLAGGIATVDLSSDIASEDDEALLRLALAQIVATATRVPGVTGVHLEVEGEPVETLGPDGIEIADPLTRANVEDQLPKILVESPLPGGAVACPVRVEGSSNVFEGTSLGVVVGVEVRQRAHPIEELGADPGDRDGVGGPQQRRVGRGGSQAPRDQQDVDPGHRGQR